MRLKVYLRSLIAVVSLGWLCLSLPAAPAPSPLQFDVFPGYDGFVPEASWFPMVFEVKNDGPSFMGTVQVTGGKFNEGQKRLLQVELPTGTLKRFVIPVFSTARGLSSWDAVLMDEKGKVRAEQLDIRPRKQVASGLPLMGSLARTAGGVPILHQVRSQQTGMQPVSARLLPSILPDSPIALEGLSCVYLNSEKVVELSANQANALRSWLLAGGHLVVAMEQVSDLTGSTWLQELMPIDPQTVRTVDKHEALQEWIQKDDWLVMRVRKSNNQGGITTEGGNDPFRNLAPDPQFESAPMQVLSAKVRDGQVLAAAGDLPLMVTAHRGAGRITVLLFSPEREPVRAWKHLPIFWAKMAEVPGNLFITSDSNQQGGWSSDAVIGAMIDSRQVHKLPMSWLFLLLIVYLVVIGPLDHYWLKRINRPMLTWITFPCYVIGFSLVIYIIGYKLRAGESEWNELHMVDVLRHEERTEVRGRSYASAYAPSNMRFRVESQQRFANFRSEFSGSWGSSDPGDKGTVIQTGDNFKADVFVPVWTSQLFVNDWMNPSGYSPVLATAKKEGSTWTINVDNRTDKPLKNLRWIVDGRVHTFEDLAPKQTRAYVARGGEGVPLDDFVWQTGSSFANAAQSRNRAFGETASGRLDDWPRAAVSLSFLSMISAKQEYQSFVAPPGIDFSKFVDGGGAMLFACSDDFAPVQPLTLFKPKRAERHTVWRFAFSL